MPLDPDIQRQLREVIVRIRQDEALERELDQLPPRSWPPKTAQDWEDWERIKRIVDRVDEALRKPPRPWDNATDN